MWVKCALLIVYGAGALKFIFLMIIIFLTWLPHKKRVGTDAAAVPTRDK